MTIASNKVSRYKGVVVFSLLKYIEIVIISLTTFFLAKKLGPAQLGEAMPILLYITYANYLALGLNQVVTKNYSRIEEERKVSFLTLNFQYLVVVSFLNILLASIVLNPEYAVLASLVSIFTIMRGYFSSYYRAVERIRVLNINNIIYSLLIFLSVVFFVSNLKYYLLIWGMFLSLSLILFISFDTEFFKKVFFHLKVLPSKVDIGNNLSEGFKLALTGIVTTVFVTCDRFIVNKLTLPLEIKGSYQLADYVGMAIYMIATTVIFYYYPTWIAKIRTEQRFRSMYLSKCIKLFFVFPFVLLLTYAFGYYLVPLFFPEYPDLLMIVVGVVFSKLGVVSLSFVSLFYIGKDKESLFLSKAVVPLLLIICFALYVFFQGVGQLLFVPLFSGCVLFFTSIVLITRLKRSELQTK